MIDKRGGISFAEKCPELAKEAYGWDPTQVSYGSKQILKWKCLKGHIYQSKPNQRSSRGDGCGVCASKIILVGFNDLATRFPQIAEQAYKWNPKKVFPGHGKKLKWKCGKGHVFEDSPDHRTNMGTGCYYCSAKRLLSGFNDLQTRYPIVAKLAYGWDPSQILPGIRKKLKWQCKKGHIWIDAPKDLIRQDARVNRCRVCFGRGLQKGENDLKTLFPEIAKKAYQWDPSKVRSNSSLSKQWVCEKGHIYKASPFNLVREVGCGVCSGDQVQKGVNDLLTIYPLVAAEAIGWDPQKFAHGSNVIKNFKCSNCGKIIRRSINSRTSYYPPNGCINCHPRGYDKTLRGFLYLMEREDEQQIGITNNPFGKHGRITKHELNGWTLLDLIGPLDGMLIFEKELEIKRWIKGNVGLIKGKHENWLKTKFLVKNFKELFYNTSIVSPDIKLP